MTSTNTLCGVAPAPKPKRRAFTADYELSVLGLCEAASPAERGALLRRERLYHTQPSDLT
ncbi:hypothetical protein ACFV1W_39135 [Kitasatospora sp. NPDC059648]|uniref:hypothetical protein n=1 Tax=Kitasatospora sp. NPDC059648 TaxID=3346894 RepID=UPI003687C7EF